MAGVSHRLWLLDIREEIAGIKAVTAETDFAGFAASWAMKRAVEHGLLLIAEAAKHIPAELKGAHADVPWRKIHGLGNLLRHEYRRSDPEILWSIVTEHLGALDNAAAALLRTLEPE
jgi:uncharacterized protein with HEPN domain